LTTTTGIDYYYRQSPCLQGIDDWYFQTAGCFQDDQRRPQRDQFDQQLVEATNFIRTTELVVALVRGHFQLSFADINTDEGLGLFLRHKVSFPKLANAGSRPKQLFGLREKRGAPIKGYRTGSKQPSGVNDLLRPFAQSLLLSKRLTQSITG